MWNEYLSLRCENFCSLCASSYLGKGMNHHGIQARGVARSIKNMDETSHSHEMRYVSTREPEKAKNCVLGHIFVSV